MTSIRYNRSVALRGLVYTDYFFGKPNYGFTPESDELEHAIFLSLDEELNVEGSDSTADRIGKPSHAGLRSVQLAAPFDVGLFANLKGCGIEVGGHLYAAHTGHHHSPVLLYCESSPKRLDDRQFFAGAVPSNTGSGFLLGRDRLIATARHVVDGAAGVTVSRGLFRSKASIVYRDPEQDLAVLQIESTQLDALIQERERVARPLRSWRSPQLGEPVHTFGFPLRPILPHTLNMTSGIVSAEWTAGMQRFQITAPVQKGNSGGPVIDGCGNLVGIVTAFSQPNGSERAENVNFAVRASSLLIACQEAKFPVTSQESEGLINPVALAKSMQSLCFEIECWRAS